MWYGTFTETRQQLRHKYTFADAALRNADPLVLRTVSDCLDDEICVQSAWKYTLAFRLLVPIRLLEEWTHGCVWVTFLFHFIMDTKVILLIYKNISTAFFPHFSL